MVNVLIYWHVSNPRRSQFSVWVIYSSQTVKKNASTFVYTMLYLTDKTIDVSWYTYQRKCFDVCLYYVILTDKTIDVSWYTYQQK